jgi:hypothetical protein
MIGAASDAASDHLGARTARQGTQKELRRRARMLYYAPAQPQMVSIYGLPVRSTGMPLTRNVLHKPIAIGLVSGALLAAAAGATTAAAGASAAAPATPTPAILAHRCTPSQPSFTSLMATATVSCREARALNTYMTRHETLAGRFVLNGETWHGAVSARAQNETDMVYRAGAQTVWLTYGGPAS